MFEVKSTRNILRNFCYGFNVLLIIASCDAISIGLAPNTKSVKGSSVDVICESAGYQAVDLFQTDTSSTKDAEAFTVCNPNSCLPYKGYTFKQTSRSVTVTISRLQRDRDEKFWSCSDQTGAEAQFKLTVYTEPKGVEFSSTKECDLAKEACHFTCQTSSCTSPAPSSFHLNYTDITGGSTQLMFGNFIQSPGRNIDDCTDNEYKYSVQITIPMNTTFPGNLVKTIQLECWLRFKTLVNELTSQPSDPVKFAVAVEHVRILPEKGGLFNVVEDKPELISCITSACRPASTVTWFKQKTGPKVRLGAGTESLVSVENDLTITNSTLTFETTRDDQEWSLFCEAVSFGTERVASNQKELNILYPTSITVFRASRSGESPVTGVLTVNEHESITGNCQVESNPASSIEISQRDTPIAKADNSKELPFHILNVTCLNNGVITCKGWNDVSDSTIATNSIQLNVNCSPRLAQHTDPVVVGRIGTAAVMSLSILAYPAPSSHDWHRLVNGESEVVKNTTNFVLTSSSLQYNLTVMNVTRHLYGSYNLTLENGIGSPLTFTFSLQNKGRPEVPTDISVAVVSPTAITITWTAGYDGEIQQQFYIQYKSSDSRDWNTVEVADRKSVSRLSVDINDLQPSTDYMLRIFSANIEGNSSLSETLTFRMKDLESSSLGAIIGGVVGGIVAVCLIIIGIFCICRRNMLPKGLETKMFGHRPNAQSTEAESKGISQQPVDDCSYAVVNKTPGQKSLVTKEPLTNAENEQAEQNYVNKGFKGDKTNSKTTTKNKQAKPGKKQKTPKNLSHDGLQYAELSFDDNGKSAKRQKPKTLKPPEGVVYDAVQIGVVGDAYYIPQNEKSGSEK